MHKTPDEDPESRHHTSFASLAKAPTENIEHIRSRSKIERECGREKGKKSGMIRHGVQMMIMKFRLAKVTMRIMAYCFSQNSRTDRLRYDFWREPHNHEEQTAGIETWDNSP